jgi:hypothetical protein
MTAARTSRSGNGQRRREASAARRVSIVQRDEGGCMQPRVLLDGLAMPESPRWHDGRLWLSNWGTREIVAVDLDGSSAVVGEGPDGLGWATNWLPDGRMLITGLDGAWKPSTKLMASSSQPPPAPSERKRLWPPPDPRRESPHATLRRPRRNLRRFPSSAPHLSASFSVKTTIASRPRPAGGRRKLPQVPASPRNGRG